MTNSHTLRTPRLEITSFSQRHLSERYVGWLNDPAVVRYSEQRHQTHTLESCQDYFCSLAGTAHHFWAIEAIDFGHIGNIGATIDEPNEVGDVAIVLGERAAWGKGYGTEAWAEVCRFLLEESGLRKVVAGTMACNAEMRAIMRKTGMSDECRHPRQFLLDGEEVDVVYAALYRKADKNGVE